VPSGCPARPVHEVDFSFLEMATPRIQRDPALRSASDLTGKVVGRFRIFARLGSGGMGEVYLAEDTGLKRRVALKRITPALRVDAMSRQRLWKEAELASRLNNPHIAAIYDVIEDGDEVFVVMEYVEGETLRQRLRRPLRIDEFLSIATQSSAALAAAHQAGLLHRDIKPENLMLTGSGEVKALDFGVARELPGPDGPTARETRESPTFSGTVPYMAPEILGEKESDARADIFSLGVVFYEALAGHNPFRRAGFLETCDAILHEEPPPLLEQNSEVPADLERIIHKMLAKNPAERYATAADLHVDLEAVQRDMAPAVARRIFRARDKTSRRLGTRFALFAAILLAAGLIGTLTYRRLHLKILNEHDSILLANFENQTDQKIFDGTVTEAVRESLQQSRYVHLVPRWQLVEAQHRMGRTEISTVDVNLGREICQRENFRALLTGRITASGSQYHMTAQVIDPWREDTVLAEEASFNAPTDLYLAVDDLTQRLRSHLGESITQIQEHAQPLQRVTTTSLEALQRYSRAMELYAAGNLEGFVPLAKNATELDPDFAMAHLYLGRAYNALGDEKNAQVHLALAHRGLDRVTERERYLILGADYDNQGNYEKAAEQYRLLTDLYPDDVEGYRWLANSSVWAGHLGDAVTAQQRAVELAPQSAVNHSQLIVLLVRLNKFSEAVAAYESAQRQGAKSPLLHWGTGLAYLGEDNTVAARRQFEQLREEGGAYEANLASLYLARVLIYEGRLGEAVDALWSGLVLDEKLHSESWMPVRRYLLAKVLWVEGKKASALRELRLLEGSALKEADPEEMRRAGVLAAEWGDISAARKILAKMGRIPSLQESAFTQSCYYNLSGVVERASGKTDSAIENQRRAAVFYPSYQAYLALADDYTARKDWQNAVKSYQSYLNFQGEILHEDLPSDWVLAHLWIARSLAGAGDSTGSLQHYDEFLRLWANADSGLSSLRVARSERKRLNAMIQKGLSSDKGRTGL
jgi:serine/threonine protein kinase/tetratricopeptide (TPR) repeat protein